MKLAYAGFAYAMIQGSSFGAVILTNGGFENGPTSGYNYTVAGWATVFDANYWSMMTNISTPPAGTNLSATYVAEGSYALRRALYSGQPVGKISFQSVEYTLSDFSLASGDQLELSLKTRAQGQAGRFETYGTLSFYDSNHTLIGTAFQTSALTSAATSSWNDVSGIAVIPDDAVYFRVAATINVTAALTNTAYAGFDSFSLVQIPEPSAMVFLVPALAAGTLAYRRRFLQS